MAASDVNTAMNAAVAALRAGDYATAIDHALAAEGLLAAMPDGRHGQQELRWDREGIDRWIAGVRRQRAGAAGIQRTKITYANPDEVDA